MRTRVVLGALFVFVVCFAVFAISRILPPAPYGLADDWRVFVAASHVITQGHSPYDASAMHAGEQAAQFYPSVQPSLDDFIDLPIVAVLLRAVTWLPYWTGFALFTAAGLVATAATSHGWMRAQGWRRTAPWVIGAVCSWPVLLGFFSGQFDWLLLAGTVGALLLLRRNRPIAAGLAIAVVLLKPHLLWPLPLLLAASWNAGLPRRRFIAAAALVLAGGIGMGFLLVPGATQFFTHVALFGSRVGAVQPDLAGLPGMLQHLPGGGVFSLVVTATGIAAVIALAVLAMRHPSSSFELRATFVLTAVAVWLACAPYAHPNDDVLLYPLIAVFSGVEGRNLYQRPLLLAAVAATVLLPVVWPFHVISVPITPLAVTLVAVCGVQHLRALLRRERDDSVGERNRRGRVLGVVVEPASRLSSQTAGSH
ncbi:MAG: glycosyltransferase family 87 protein [Candidatus Dormibacteria bacterium]